MSASTAFEILYRDYHHRVYGLCRRLLNSDTQAEDATQEAFMRAYRNFSRYDSKKPFWQWMASIASNHCIDILRRRNRTEALFSTEAEEESLTDRDASTALEMITSEEEASHINEAVAELPDKYRVPLLLAYFRELSYDEIAGELNISRNHVGVLLLRAKQQLREQLQAGQGVQPQQARQAGQEDQGQLPGAQSQISPAQNQQLQSQQPQNQQSQNQQPQRSQSQSQQPQSQQLQTLQLQNQQPQNSQSQNQQPQKSQSKSSQEVEES